MKDCLGIVIPHFNDSSYLLKLLGSLKDFGSQIQVVVVDDNSEDQEFEKLDECDFSWLTLLKNDTGFRGPSVCRNIGWHYLNTNFVVFVDSDDHLKPHFIEQRLAAGAPYEGECCLLIFPGAIWDARIELEIPFPQDGKSPLFLRGQFLKENPPFHLSSVLWTKKALHVVDGFDECLTCMEDPDIHIRALSHPKIKTINTENLSIDFHYRVGHKSLQKKDYFIQNSILGRFPFYQKMFQWSEIDLAEILPGFQTFFLQFLAANCLKYPKEVLRYREMYITYLGKDAFLRYVDLYCLVRKRKLPMASLVYYRMKKMSKSVLR